MVIEGHAGFIDFPFWLFFASMHNVTQTKSVPVNMKQVDSVEIVSNSITP